jgi:uncharacterized protein (TIGR00251 family)
MQTEPRARPWRCAKDGLLLAVRVSPKASRDGIDGLAETPQGPAVQVRVRAVPDQGEANAAVAAVVARWLGVASSKVAVARGHKSRVKTLAIGGEPAALEALVAARVEALGEERDGGDNGQRQHHRRQGHRSQSAGRRRSQGG